MQGPKGTGHAGGGGGGGLGRACRGEAASGAMPRRMKPRFLTPSPQGVYVIILTCVLACRLSYLDKPLVRHLQTWCHKSTLKAAT